MNRDWAEAFDSILTFAKREESALMKKFSEQLKQGDYTQASLNAAGAITAEKIRKKIEQVMKGED
jgi:hypothetical protein